MLKHTKKSNPGLSYNHPCFTLQTDASGKIMSASPELLAYSGRSENELIGNPISKIVTAADAKKLQAFLKKANLHDSAIIPLTVKGKKGSKKVPFTIEHKKGKDADIILWTGPVPVTMKVVSVKGSKRDNWFDKFFRYSNDLLCIIDKDGIVRDVNKSLAGLLGYSSEEICRHQVTDFVHPDDLQRTIEIIRIHTEGQSTKEFENRFCCKNGDIKWLSWSTTFLDQELLMATGRDVTDKKMAQEATRYQANVLENVFDAVISSDARLCIRSWNRAAEQLYGLKAEQVMGHTIHEFISLTYSNTTRTEVLNELYTKGSWTGEASFTRPKDGKKITFLSAISILKDSKGHITDTIAINKDITEGRAAEHAVHESEQRFRQFADSAPVMIWISDQKDNTIYVNKHWTDFTGLTKYEISGDDAWSNLVYIDDVPTAIEEYKTHFRNREPFLLEYRIKTREGHYRWVLDNGMPRFLEDGTFIGYIGSVMDIHDRKMAEQNIRFQAQVMENVYDGIISTDLDFRVISFNKAAENMYGFKTEDITGRHIRDFIDHQYLGCSREEALKELYEKDSWEGQMYYDRRDGRRIYMHCALAFVKNEKGQRIGFAGIHRDITEQRRSENALRISEERYRSLLSSITDGFIAVDANFNILLWNHAVERVTGMRAASVIGKNIVEVFPKFIGTDEYHKYLEAISNSSTANYEHPIPEFDCWVETSVYPSPQGVFVYFKDITERKKQQQLLSLEKKVLEINSQPTVSLNITVDYFLEGLERIFPGMKCSVLTLDEDKQSMKHMSGPSLPVEYCTAIDGIKIGPMVGSCGTAMFTKEKVITYDIQNDERWTPFRDLAARSNLRSCWSFPIINAKQEVLATIATYYSYPKLPSMKEVDVFERVSNLLRVIIENKNAESRIRISNERYLLVTKATNDAIWDWDVSEDNLYWGEGFYNLFGHKPGVTNHSFGFWEQCVHPEDRDRVINGISQFLTDPNSTTWEDEYRFKKANGQFVLVYDRGFLIFDHSGKINRMVGSMQDITEKREMEKKLLKQELDKQKLVAQAVVNAQEKERAEIGKELHDNVNQILSTAKLYLELAKNDHNERISLITRSTDNISDAINEIRNISRSLVPASVGDLGLIESIQDLVENIRATRKLGVEFYHLGRIDRILDEKRKLMLFRIIQEQVNNVLKHANATNLIIALVSDGANIDLTISDDGTGFEPESIRANKGVGLSNITSRAELFNGKVNITSAPEQGCTLSINIPISNL